MNDAAAPPREEVRSHKVVGTLRGLKSGSEALVVTNEASKAHRNEKATTSGSGKSPTLTRQDNGKIRLEYSVAHHTKYQRSGATRVADPQLFGHTLSGWNKITRAHDPIRRALEGGSIRQELLDSVVKERMLYDIRASGVRADLLNVSGSSKFMTRWETVAVCALLNIPGHLVH